MKAVHFGAGNIGRGFVGLLLHEAGYEVVFADVNDELIGALQTADSYVVHEVGPGATARRVDGFRAVNSQTDEDRLVQEIASADVVTCAVGPNVLRFIAPVIARGLAARADDAAPLAVMACENAINATDTLAAEIRDAVTDAGWDQLAARAVFANTAVDRIVPVQPPGAGVDVTVEVFYEWVIERRPFGDSPPPIGGATFVDALGPYIERKLFTVNTGHATTAYFGYRAGAETIAQALADDQTATSVRRVLEETSALLVEKHGLDRAEQDAYREKILGRFANEHLPDTVERVGRQPLRKLGRHERLVGPAAELAERGIRPDALLEAIGAALGFDAPEDDEAVQLTRLLAEEPARGVVEQVTGLSAEHPLSADLVTLVETEQTRRTR